MKVGEYITCKKNFYKRGENWYFRGKFPQNIVHYFQKPLYKKGKKYKIIDIGVTNSLSLFYGAPNAKIKTKPIYTLEDGFKFTPPLIWDIFYSRKEERNIKLKILKNL